MLLVVWWEFLIVFIQVSLKSPETKIPPNFLSSKGHNSSDIIRKWPATELDHDIMAINILTKFGKNRIRYVHATVRKP